MIAALCRSTRIDFWCTSAIRWCPCHGSAVGTQIGVCSLVFFGSLDVVPSVVEEHHHPHAATGRDGERSLHPLVLEFIPRDPHAAPGTVDQRDERPIAGTRLGDERQPTGGARGPSQPAAVARWPGQVVAWTVLLAGARIGGVCGGGTCRRATAEEEWDGSTPAAEQVTAHQARAGCWAGGAQNGMSSSEAPVGTGARWNSLSAGMSPFDGVVWSCEPRN